MRPCAVLLVLAVLAGCGGNELAGPPTLRPGRDECAECGMSIDDERFAAALLIERDGRREHLCYDDIGCMLDARRKAESDLHVIEAFVRDYDTSAWLATSAAAYIAGASADLHTPMGSGIAAFKDAAGAERGRATFGGERVTHDALAGWREARLEERKRRGSGER